MAPTCRLGLLLGAVVLGATHLDLDDGADDAAAVLGQVAGAQDLHTGWGEEGVEGHKDDTNTLLQCV